MTAVPVAQALFFSFFVHSQYYSNLLHLAFIVFIYKDSACLRCDLWSHVGLAWTLFILFFSSVCVLTKFDDDSDEGFYSMSLSAVHSQTMLDTCTCHNDPAWISNSCVLTETTLDTCMHLSCAYQNDPAWISNSCVLTYWRKPHWIHVCTCHAHIKMILLESPTAAYWRKPHWIHVCTPVMRISKWSCLNLQQPRIDGNHTGYMYAHVMHISKWSCLNLQQLRIDGTTLDTCACQNDPDWNSHWNCFFFTLFLCVCFLWLSVMCDTWNGSNHHFCTWENGYPLQCSWQTSENAAVLSEFEKLFNVTFSFEFSITPSLPPSPMIS